MSTSCRLQGSEEQKELDSNECQSDVTDSRDNGSIVTTDILHSTSTEIVLESIEECVGCIDGIREQQNFEENLLKQAVHQRQIAMAHGLSEAEAALIRLQMIDIDATATTARNVANSAADGIRSAVENTLSTNIISPRLDDILEQVCGVRHSNGGCLASSMAVGGDSGNSCNITNNNRLPANFCEGIVQPIDTTLPTSLPGNDLVESKQARTARSLVDVAAEDEALQETDREDFTIDAGAIHECAICNDSAATSDTNDFDNGSSRTDSPLGGSMRRPVFCRLPCCDEEDPRGGRYSNFNVCTACILVLTVATKDGIHRVGRCPRCRQWISVLTLHSTSASMEVRKVQSGKCEGCLLETSPLIVEEPATCDACFLAGETSLTYECEGCHQPQAIQSILYRSQPSTKSFSNEKYPCNNCDKSTHWRILHDQLHMIPANDIPEQWGDNFLELARARVHKARQGIAKLNLMGQNAERKEANYDNCTVM